MTSATPGGAKPRCTPANTVVPGSASNVAPSPGISSSTSFVPRVPSRLSMRS